MTDIFDADFDIRTVRAATPRQIDYVLDLRADYEEARNEWAALTGQIVKPIAWGALPATMAEASATIDKAKDAVHEMRQARNAARTAGTPEIARVELSEGMWIVGELGKGGTIYKIQRAVHGSGNLYAKALTESGFEYVPGSMNEIALTGRKLSLTEAKEYGALYGTCCVCGRTLTDENSIAAGIGPVCASKF